MAITPPMRVDPFLAAIGAPRKRERERERKRGEINR